MSAAEVKQIIAAVKADGEKTREYIGQLLVAGYTVGRVRHKGGNLVAEEIQRRLALDDADGPNK